MGNQACCRHDIEQDKAMDRLNHFEAAQIAPKDHSEYNQANHYHELDASSVPTLPERAQTTLDTQRFFYDELSNQTNPYTKRYANEIYVGDLDDSKKRPHGLGRMYKSNGLYIGYFNNGKAQGRGVFIFQDGSYYEGEFNKNCAEDIKGTYKSPSMTYTGGFKNNTFHGDDAYEQGENYQYIGEYNNGVRTRGTLTWQTQGKSYRYDGYFNANNEFHGEGKLREPYGDYEGQFYNGEKHGYGIYNSNNGMRYEGTYSNGYRDGYGTIYNDDNTIYYKGQMSKDLPHGNGTIKIDGKQIKSTFIQGIDSKEIEGV